MSSSSVLDFVSSTSSIVHDETSNQSVEIPDPPALTVTHISPNNNNTNKPATKSDQLSDRDENDHDDDEQEAIPMNITFNWIDEQMRAGVDLRPILSRLLPGLPDDISPSALFELLMDLFLPVQQRHPLEQYKTLDDAVELIRKCKNILVLTGAGISVSCGSKSFYLRSCTVSLKLISYHSSPRFSISQWYLRSST